IEDDSEDEADDDMGYDPFDIRGDDEVELTNEESSDNKDQIAEVFRIDTNVFDYDTPICSAFKEFNYLLKIDPDLLIKDIEGFKTYDDYKDDWIYEWNKNVSRVDEKPWTDTGVWTKPTPALEDCELKDLALRNKASMEGLISDDDNESCYEQRIRWDVYTNYDDAYEINHDGNNRKKNDEYVAIKEMEYDYLTITSKRGRTKLPRNLQKGRRMERDLVKEISTNIGGEFSNLEDLEVLES
ncbi:hypothetical protein Tco_0601258, partial [Tanacetum coccineum]